LPRHVRHHFALPHHPGTATCFRPVSLDPVTRDFRLESIIDNGLQNASLLFEFRATAALKEFDVADPMRPGGSMKPSTEDQIKGKLHEMKGKVKEKAGQVTNNPNLVAEGQDEKLAGKVQKKVGQIEKVFEK
jgi:uncharacterized protein YjbJ (UPF0337 family)